MNTGSNPVQRRVIAGSLFWYWCGVGALVVIAFVLGWVGFATALKQASGQSFPAWLVLTTYRAATLFTPEPDFANLVPHAGPQSEQWEIAQLFVGNRCLQIARILAPFTTLFVILQLLVSLAQSAGAGWWLREVTSIWVGPLETLQRLVTPAAQRAARFLVSESREGGRHAPGWLRRLAAADRAGASSDYEKYVPWDRRHVVICGLGKTGMRLVEEFRNCDRRERRRVVVIEAAPTEEQVARCRNLGVWIVVGDATHGAALCDAGVPRAERIIITVGQQVDRLEIAAQSADLCRDRARQLLIHIRVDRSSSAGQLRESPVLPASRGLSLPVPFSTHQYIARCLLARHPLASWAAWRGQERVHVILFGFSVMSEELALVIGRLCHSCWFRLPRVTWVVPDPAAARAAFLRHYPEFERACELVFQQGPPERGVSAVVAATRDLEPVTAIFVCDPDPSTALRQAHEVRAASRQARRWLAPVFAYLPDAQGLAPYTHAASREPRFANVFELFGALEQGRLRSEVIEGRQEIVPRLKHQAYLLSNSSVQADRDWTNPELPPWRTAPAAHATPNDLDVTLQESNRWAAEFIPTMLAAAGCAVGRDVRTITPQAPLPRDATTAPWVLEELAKLEHQRWMAERYINGWSHDELRENARKKHNLLVDWAEVPEVEQRKDHNAVLSLTGEIKDRRTGEVSYILRAGRPAAPSPFGQPGRVPAECIQPLLCVGIIGHCRLSPQQRAALAATLRDTVLPKLIKDFPGHYFRLLSALAPGADTVFARTATDFLAGVGRANRAHWHGLHVVEPFPVAQVLDFRGANPSLAAGAPVAPDLVVDPERGALEDRAEWIIDLLPAGEQARDLAHGAAAATRRHEQYERACAYVVERSHVLIAAFDPNRNGASLTSTGRRWRAGLESIPAARSSWPEAMRSGQYRLLREHVRLYNAGREAGEAYDTVTVMIGEDGPPAYDRCLAT